eukprot:TRINITY_DN2097_c0_g1_i1.p1 TRINITY_DN2097_c0_g1~~TRINITY_DN2097_c0_g1_i1.p1  ORF type:complete len:475 (+),score=41.18 TRINITY_DN2097_c0_g1_i1:148-1572(+)
MTATSKLEKKWRQLTERNKLDETLLHVACKNGRKDTVDWVLKTSKKLSCFVQDLTDKNGWTALHFAAINGHLRICRSLLEYGASPLIVTIDGCTPLHFLAEVNLGPSLQDANLNYVMTMLQNQCAVKNNNGELPIHIAAFHGYFSNVQLLLTYGGMSTLFSFSHKGWSPYDYACQGKKPEIAELIRGLTRSLDFNISDDVMLNILAFSTSKDLAVFSRVCKTFYRICSSERLWQAHCKKENIAVPKGSFYKETYFAEKRRYLKYSSRINWQEWHNPSLKQSDVAPKNMKIRVVGNKGVGKTALFEHFMQGTRSSNYQESAFDKFVRVNSQLVKIFVEDSWEFSRFSLMAVSPYRGCQGIVICCDVTNRQSYESIYLWKSDFERYAPKNCSIIVAGNKIDDAGRVVSYEEAKKYCDNVSLPYIEVSATNGRNVHLVFALLVEKFLKETRSSARGQTGSLPSLAATKPPEKNCEVM